jgi:hypothetical protein
VPREVIDHARAANPSRYLRVNWSEKEPVVRTIVPKMIEKKGPDT